MVQNGVIQEVGPTRRLENLAIARHAVEINAAGRLVMPGFVDSHTHLAFPLGNRATSGSSGNVRTVSSPSRARLAARARAQVEAMARHGTTTVEVKTGCGPDENAETKLLRVLRTLKNDPIDLIPTFLFHLPGDGLCGAHDAAAEWVFRELLPKIRRGHLARFADLAWNANPTWHGRFSRYLQAARQLGFLCKIHADQVSTADAIRMAIEHLVVSIDHLEHASPGEVAMLAQSSTIATLLPATSFHAGTEFAPARELIDAGAAVALASNFNPRHTPALSMQTVVALACRHMRMTPEEAICAATINGAHALGRARSAGSLEIGKSADLLVLSVPDYHDMVHHFGSNLVHLTMKRGEIIYEEGEVAHLPVEQLRLCW
ncbi:MAG: amidohydrolase family protein [Candidatus Sulfopaludibacter sp.]|nr:amidohydrolase family protein [Candidatus Sulfopaludibacter sp.]